MSAISDSFNAADDDNNENNNKNINVNPHNNVYVNNQTLLLFDDHIGGYRQEEDESLMIEKVTRVVGGNDENRAQKHQLVANRDGSYADGREIEYNMFK